MFSHEPIINPRNDTLKEILFLKAWRKYANQIFSHYGEDKTYFEKIFPAQIFNQERASEVAASFMVFMGCNAGISFTYMADKLHNSNQYISRPNAFLAMWSIENKREIGVNSNIRYVESILTPRNIFDNPHLRQIYINKNISLEDYEIIEEMVMWWGSFDANTIKEEVNAQYEKIRATQKEMA